ncbi:helix-turn-helix domain-containing protein [Streptomyces leeuwenhoekii]|uniref:helix-turn-helix domain-containing protein n=1 Tax=Streptomyces leeuwenhoekii TaxID=1437453 RepID=UPI0036B91EEC
MLDGGPGRGRPRKYCGNTCRQAAHRRRGGTLAKATAPRAAEPEPSRPSAASRAAVHAPSAGDELIAELAKDIQDGARELARLLPSLNGDEPLRRVAQLDEQLEGLTAALVGRARHRRVTWSTISTILRISEDTARHRYTERFILRRLARFNRTGMPLTSLTRLFTSAAPHGSGSHDRGGSTPLGESGEPATDRGEGTDQSAPRQPSGAAFNRLSPILSMLVRTAQLSNKEVSSRIGCSASYLSRVLSGERVPTWDLTRKFAQACGADPDVLRTVWESEKLSSKDRDPDPPDPDAPALPAVERLRAAVHTLHLRAGRPAPSDVAVASRWLLSTSAVASILEGTLLPHPDILTTFVRVLGGDVPHFSRLLDEARNEATCGTRLLPSPAHHTPQPTTPPGPVQDTAIPPAPALPRQPSDANVAGEHLAERIEAFSKVFTEDETVEDGRARLLDKLAEQHQHAPGAGERPGEARGAGRPAAVHAPADLRLAPPGRIPRPRHTDGAPPR